MPKPALAFFVILPFLLWDGAVFFMRNRGDRTPQRREEILRHFTENDIAAGREHVIRHNRLFPLHRLIFYVFYGLLLFGGLGARLERALLPLTGQRWYLALPLFLLAVLAAKTVITMPVSAYATFVIERDMGLSTITVGTWLFDIVKSLVLTAAVGTLVALPVLALVKALPRHWPFPAAAVILALSAFGIWISPWLIDPLFNKFEPMRDERLAGMIRDAGQGAGMDVRQVYVMDASRRSLYLNAYFTGLGNSRRIVLYDTLVDECGPQEVLSVVGHELGHWKAGHVMKGFLLQSAAAFAGLWAVWWLLNSPGARSLLGLPFPSSLVLLVLLPFLGSLAGTLASPAASAVSRSFERQADHAALEITRDCDACIEVEKKLVRKAKADLLKPRLVQWFYGSHPLPEERIEAAELFGDCLPRKAGSEP